MPNSSGLSGRLAQGLSMPMHLIGFGAFGSALLDGSESDGTNILLGGTAALTSDWNTLDGTLTANNAVAPNGATEAARFLESATTERHGIYALPAITPGDTHTVSVYAKPINRQYIQIFFICVDGAASKVSVYFDLVNGTVTDSDIVANDSGIVSYGTPTIQKAYNGFYKCTIPNVVLNNTGSTAYLQLMSSDVGTYGSPLSYDSPSYAGNTSNGTYWWRPKLVVV